MAVVVHVTIPIPCTLSSTHASTSNGGVNDHSYLHVCTACYGSRASGNVPVLVGEADMTGLPYKDTFAAKGSALYAALTEGPEKDRAAKAAAIYKDTTNRFHATLAWRPPVC